MKQTILLVLFCIVIQNCFTQTPLYSRGSDLIDSGKSIEAIEVLTQSIENQESPEWIPYTLRAVAYANIEKFVCAFDDIQKALHYANANKKRDGGHIHSIYAISSDIYKVAGNFQKSLEDLNIAIKTSPDKNTALNHTVARADFFYIAGNFSASIADYNRVLKIFPNNDKTKLALCRSIIAEQEENAKLTQKINKKKVEKALSFIDEILKKDAEYLSAYKFRVRANSLINNYLPAIEDAYKYRSFYNNFYSGKNDNGSLSYAENLFLFNAAKDTVSAKKILFSQIEKTPKNPLPYFLFAKYYSEIQKNYKEAINFITKTINNANSELGLLLGERAQYYYNLKEYDKALEDLHLCKQMNDSLTYFHYLEGLALYKIDSLNAAAQAFGKCIELSPTINDGYRLRAMIYTKMKNFELAKIDLDSAYNIDNQDIEVYYSYASLYSEMENREKSNEYYEMILTKIHSLTNIDKEINENYMATIYNNMSYNYIKLKKYEQADSLIEKALTMEQSSSYIWDTRGELYFCIGEYEKCIADMSRAIKLSENDRDNASNSYFYRGRAKIALGQTESGNEDIQKAAEMKHDEAIEFLKINH
ncbi:MAG: hypothetical protein LBB53_06365 [Prevotellaceae bacterium]|jgi:tetratricopeptide (TPR) repeat protein|nr:hypothetical protein [Prevotellaceae bacterium]